MIGSTSAFEFVHGCVAGRAADVPYRFYAAVVNGGHVLTDVRPEVSPGWATSGGLPDPSCQAVGTDAASTVVGPALRPVVPDSDNSRRVCVPGPQTQSTPGSGWLRAVGGALAIGTLAPLRVDDFPAESGPQAVVLRPSRCRSRTHSGSSSASSRVCHRLGYGYFWGSTRYCTAVLSHVPSDESRADRASSDYVATVVGALAVGALASVAALSPSSPTVDDVTLVASVITVPVTAAREPARR